MFNGGFSFQKILQSMIHSLLAHRAGHSVGSCLHLGRCLSHGNAYGSMLQHGNVVASVAESHGLARVDAEVLAYHVKAQLFVAALGRDVGKGRMPTSYLASTDEGQERSLLFDGDERRYLQKFTLLYIRKLYFLNGGYVEEVIEDFLYELARAADEDVSFVHEDTRLVQCPAVVFDVGGFFRGNASGLFVNHPTIHIAIGSVHGDVAVDESQLL